MAKHGRRFGFTLIELLVVIGICSVLIALLLPSVQKLRASAERAKCSNQLRQVGIALIRYHDERGVLPMGVTPSAAKYDYPTMSWMTRLLPHIEQESLWQSTLADYQKQRNPFRGPPHVNFAQPVNVWACPADSRGPGPHPTHHNRSVAVTNYLGVLGINYTKGSGMLYGGSKTRFADVADGTANTLLVGERPAAGDFWYGWWYAGVGMHGTGSLDSVLGVNESRLDKTAFTEDCETGPYHFEGARLDDTCAVFHFWSLHPGGAHFLMCDGSVHFLSYSADKVLPALATRAGGESVEVP